MDVKKKALAIFMIVFLFLCFGVAAGAAEENEAFDDLLEASAAESLLDGLDEETYDLLSKLGIDSVSLDTLLDVSPRKVISLIFDIAQGKLSDISKYIFVLLGIIILISLIDTFVDDKNKTSGQFSTLYTLFFAIAVITPLISCVSDVMSAVKLTSDFSLLLIPVFAGLITAAGNPMLALSYNSLTFSVAEIISQFASKYMSSFIGVNLSLCVTGAVNPLLNSGTIIASIKKIFTVLLSLLTTLFVGLLSIKGLLASSADGLTVKGAKFLIGTFIPVIGSSLSDGLSSVMGSLSLLNSVVGVLGIIIIALINLPVIIETLLWWFVLAFCSFACNMLGKTSLASFLDGLSGVVVMLSLLLIFVAFIFIISAGLTLSMGKS